MTGDKFGFGVLGPLLMTVDGAPVSPGTPKQRAVRRAISPAEQLSRLGYDRVHYVAGGYAAWHRRTTPR
jgi:hypothetical protein